MMKDKKLDDMETKAQFADSIQSTVVYSAVLIYFLLTKLWFV